MGIDQAVAVAVEALERGAGAEELAAGDVAVAVAIHLAEPERPGGRRPRAGDAIIGATRNADMPDRR